MAKVSTKRFGKRVNKHLQSLAHRRQPTADWIAEHILVQLCRTVEPRPKLKVIPRPPRLGEKPERPPSFSQRLASLVSRGKKLWQREGAVEVARRSVGKILRKLKLRPPIQPPEPASTAPQIGLSYSDTHGELVDERDVFQTLNANQSARVILRMKRRPLVSIVVPVYRVAPRWLEWCIRSVWVQYYPNWELILIDDRSESPELTALMREWADRDSRIRLVELQRNQGIAGATNAGLDVARGEFIGFLDHDDELTPDALTWMMAYHNQHPEAEWFYSDEDKIDPDGYTENPFHKPSFSLPYLLSCMYTCHFSVYSTDVIRRLEGIRLGYDGSQDHDLALRFSELVPSDRIVHIPRVLYHWRVIPESAASGSEAKPYAGLAGRRAVRDALARRGIDAEVTSSRRYPTLHRVEYRPSRTPRVTVIIPTRDAVEDVRLCVDSLRANTDYSDYDILVVDNQSTDPALADFLRTNDIRTLRYDKPFNHSAMNNAAVESVDSEWVVFLNNDVEITSPRWLEQMVGMTELDDRIAGVGPLMLYPDGTIQHAGMIYGLHDNVAHAHKHVEGDTPGYYCRVIGASNFTGCTAAFLLMKRAAFLKVGGFRADRFPNSYNDADLWLRLADAGHQCVYNPLVQATHYESKSRTVQVDEVELEARRRFVRDWKDRLDRDPFYNPNLALDNEAFVGFRDYPIPRALLDGESFRRAG